MNDIKERAMKEWLAKQGNVTIHKKPSKEQKENIAIKRREWEKRKRLEKPMFVCTQRTRSAFARVFRGGGGFFNNELGRVLSYSREELVKHIENKFTDEMNWDNYGKYWQLDHIKPVNSFNYETIYDDDFIKCWNLSNLQPLTPENNRKKWFNEM